MYDRVGDADCLKHICGMKVEMEIPPSCIVGVYDITFYVV